MGFLCWVLYREVGYRILLPIAERQIRGLTGAQVTIGNLEFSSNAVARIHNLTLRSQQDEHYGGEILKADEVEGRFSFWSVLRLRPRLKYVTLRQFEVSAQYNADAREWNLADLDITRSSSRAPLPIVNAENGVLKLQVVRNNVVRPLAIAGIRGMFSQVHHVENTYSFYLSTDNSLGYVGSELRGIWQAGPEGKITVSGQVLMGNTPIYGNSWDMRNLNLQVSYTKEEFSIDKLDFTAGASGYVSLTGVVRDFRNEGEFELDLEVIDWYLVRGKGHNVLAYNDDILAPFTKVKELMNQYQPEGRGDIELSLKGRLDNPAAGRLTGLVRCRDMTVRNTRFPYPLEHITGLLEVTENSLNLTNLRGRHGEVEVLIEGHSRKTSDGMERQLRMVSENMRLDEDLYKALNDRQKSLWYIFSPTGRARIDYCLQQMPGEDAYGKVDVELLDVDAVFQHFPYPLTHLTGLLILDPNRVELRDVVSRKEDRAIHLNGAVTEIKSENPRFNIVIDANNIPIDDTLKAALPTRQREFYESFQVDAKTNVRIKIFPNEVGRRPVEYIAWATINDASLVYEKFPLPLIHVYARAQITPDVVILEEMKGRNGEGTVQVSGYVWPINDRRDQTGFCLQINAQQLELKEQWLGSLPEKTAKVIEQVHPTGHVNIDAQLNRNAPQDACHDNRVVVECLGNGFTYEQFPYPVENLTGQLTVVDRRVTLENITIPEMVITPELADALTGAARQFVLGLEPNGTLEVRIDHAVYEYGPDDPGQVDFGGEVRFHDCGIGRSQVVTNLYGRSSGTGRYVIGQGLFAAAGIVEASTLRIKGREVTRLRADVVYDPNDGTFISRNFGARCYEGKVLGDMTVHRPTREGMAYALDVLFDEVAFRGLATEQMVTSGQTSPQRPGWASGALQVRGVLGSEDSLVGRLSAGVVDVEVARRSMLGKVLTALQMSEPTDYMFHTVTADAYLQGNEVIFERVTMMGRSLVLEGTGRLDLENLDVHLTFRAGRTTPEGPSFLESLAAALGSAMVKVEVQGNIDDPKIATDALPAMSRPLYIFKDGK
ncbi:MAG: hypothetical protein JXA82_08095 [Sedimentisphaerales bacterium]|nr:hypothetical protein [Sedimentisphaerales bacterium]